MAPPPCIGIDLGAAKTMVVGETGEIVRNELGGHSSASLVGFSGDERYVVALSSVRQTVAVKSENLILPAGALVRVVGTSRAELNGRQGTVQSWDGGAGRYVVQTSASDQLKLRLCNVELV